MIITGVPQLGASPPPSGLGLDPVQTGFLQLAFGLAVMNLWAYFRDNGGEKKGI